MNIFGIDIETFEQDFKTNNKEKNGEVHTDFKLINDMLDLIPKKCFTNPTLKWLDPCAGRGYFGMVLYKRLFLSLKKVIPDEKERHTHIVEQMIYMIEVNIEFIPILIKLFGEKCHIYNENFVTLPIDSLYDIVIGNPPYNIQGQVVLNTQTVSGKGCWTLFIKKALSVIKKRGYLCFITPSIWMKNDHPLFKSMMKWNIKKIHTLNNTETNKIFHGHAQTPTSYFLIRKIKKRKEPRIGIVNIYDKFLDKYIKYNSIPLMIETYHKGNGIPNEIDVGRIMSLPLFGVSIIKKLQKFVKKAGYINVTKTNMRPGYKGLDITHEPTDSTPYPNITTCILNGLQPELVINFSNIQCAFYDVPKLVLAHKMYGFPFLDISGVYGVSNRDNYVICNKTNKELLQLKNFLSTNFIITLYESTRYRMKYLERYIFEMLPDITKLTDFPEDINDETLFDYFGLDKLERKLINNFHKKRYLSL